MAWICPKCNTNNANLNTYCVYCRHKVGIAVSRIENKDDTYDEIDSLVSQVIIYKTKLAELGFFDKRKDKMPLTEEEINANPNMSEKEKRHTRWWASEKILIVNMDDLSLKAHIEELQLIASESSSRLASSDDELRTRKAKQKGIKATVDNDDARNFNANAINNINERSKKMSKVEKEIERLVDMGISRGDAENMYKATTINRINKLGVAGVIEENKRLDISTVVNSVMNPSPPEVKEFTNPFAKKEEIKIEFKPEPNTPKPAEITISEVEIVGLPEKKIFTNPFASKKENQ